MKAATTPLGPLQKRALVFARKYPGWHSYAKDGTTERVINRLSRRGLVEVNGYRQFKAV